MGFLGNTAIQNCAVYMKTPHLIRVRIPATHAGIHVEHAGRHATHVLIPVRHA